jgi:transposase-like protein
MKTKQPAKDLTLIQLFDRFGTDEKARSHLEKVLWPNGIVCPHCQCNEPAKFSDITPNPKAKTRAGLRWCSNCKVMPSVNGANLKQVIRENVQINSNLYTDKHHAFNGLGFEYNHGTVKHGVGEFKRVEGENVITTASVESFFSLLKRGVVGTFHHVSAQHLPLYFAEFDHRHNCRKMTDG